MSAKVRAFDPTFDIHLCMSGLFPVTVCILPTGLHGLTTYHEFQNENISPRLHVHSTSI